MTLRSIAPVLITILVAYGQVAVCQWYPFYMYTTADGLPHNNIMALAQDGRGFLWIGTDEAGLTRFDGKEFVSFDVHETGIPNGIRCIAADGASRVFVGTASGIRCIALNRHADDRPDSVMNAFLSRWQGEIHHVSVPRPGILHVRAGSQAIRLDYAHMHVLEQRQADAIDGNAAARSATDRCGRTWMWDGGSLRCLTSSDTIVLNERNGLRFHMVRALLCDREGSLWCGTTDGLLRLTADRLISYTDVSGLPEGQLGVWRITEDQDRSIWFSTVGGGVARLRTDGTLSSVLSKQLRSKTVSDIVLEDAKRRIVGTFAGLHFIDGDDVHVLASRDGLPDDHVEFVLPSRFGGYWISTRRGLARLSSDGMKTYTMREGLPSDRVTQCVEDSYGDLWIGTHGGACTMTRTAGYRISRLPMLAGVRVSSVFIDRQKRPWFGSMGTGVYALIDGRLLHITRAHGLAGNTVYFVSQDRQGAMYFGTNAGVSVLPESMVPLFVSRDSALRAAGSPRGVSPAFRHSALFTISTKTGLINNEMNSGAVMRDSSGNMWFGCIGGVSRYTPLRDGDARGCITAETLRPGRIITTRLQIGDTPVGMTDSLRLGPDDQLLQLRWTLPSFRNPGDVRVLYRLEGLESTWHESADGTIGYSGLQAGTYALVARATIGEGVWTGEQTLLTLVIDPPYYMTVWFWGLVLAGLSGIGYLWHRVRTRQLVEIERMRTRIALDLHDDIGASLSTISLLGDVELLQRKGDNNERLDRIISIARRSVESISDIVWSINPEKDTVSSLAERMHDVAETAARAAHIDVQYSYDEKLTDCAMNVHARRNALLLFKEAVNNAVKHSGCRRLECSVRRAKGWMEILIRDDGKGFDVRREFGGNGVRGMQHRAGELGWDLRIESSPAGTDIHVLIPLER